MDASYTVTPGSLAALSRHGVGEAEMKPGKKDLNTIRMVHWFSRKKGVRGIGKSGKNVSR